MKHAQLHIIQTNIPDFVNHLAHNVKVTEIQPLIAYARKEPIHQKSLMIKKESVLHVYSLAKLVLANINVLVVLTLSHLSVIIAYVLVVNILTGPFAKIVIHNAVHVIKPKIVALIAQILVLFIILLIKPANARKEKLDINANLIVISL